MCNRMTRPGDHAAEVQSCRETLSTRTTLSSSISGQQNAVRRARRRSIELCPYLNEVLIKKQVRISTSCLISCSPNTRNISLPVGLASRRSCCGRSSVSFHIFFILFCFVVNLAEKEVLLVIILTEMKEWILHFLVV